MSIPGGELPPCAVCFGAALSVVTVCTQVSHHIHCNDVELDEDVFSAFPFLRFDARMPRKWFHKYQHLYMVQLPATVW